MHSDQQYLKFARILMDEYKAQKTFELDLSSYHYQYVIAALQKLGCDVVSNGFGPARVTVTRPEKPVRKNGVKKLPVAKPSGIAHVA